MGGLSLSDAQVQGVVVGLVDYLDSQGNPVPRLDVDVFLTEHTDAFNLFCLALIQLQTKDTSKMNYYEIAGIHGVPKQYWDGVSAGAVHKSSTDTTDEGYCAHGVPTFGPWHRPYLAMMEQTIYKKMIDIAGSFTDPATKNTYQTAAKQFRLPYWDYFKPRGTNKTYTVPDPSSNTGKTQSKTYAYDFAVPRILTEPFLWLRQSPDNSWQSMANPLQLFNFPSPGLSTSDWEIASGLDQSFTQRHASSGVTSDQELNWTINGFRAQMDDLICHMMSEYTVWNAFGNSGFTPRAKYGSLEDLHGEYHNLIGGNGHMSSIAVSAFDPIFWLHHCQIDRLLAIWQAANPTAWVDNINDPKPLLPFRSKKTPEEFWSSADSRSTNKFGYTYPDLLKSDVKTTFANNYTWATTEPCKSSGPPDGMKVVPVDQAPVFKAQPSTGTGGGTTSSRVAAPSMESDPIQVPMISAREKKHPAGEKKHAEGEKKHAEEEKKHPTSKPSAEQKAIALQRSIRNGDDAAAANAAKAAIDEAKIHRHWFVDTIVERMALNGTFTIYFFFGPPPPGSDLTSQYLLYPTLGTSSHFLASPIEFCDNCGNQQVSGHLVTSTRPINTVLVEHLHQGNLSDLTPASVKPFLVENLKWRVVKTETGGQVDPRTVAGLQLGISCKLTPTDGGDVTYESHPEIIQEIIERSS